MKLSTCVTMRDKSGATFDEIITIEDEIRDAIERKAKKDWDIQGVICVSFERFENGLGIVLTSE